MKYYLITTLLFIVHTSFGQTNDCHIKYDNLTKKKINNNRSLSHSYNELVKEYNLLSDCTINKKDRDFIEKYLSRLKVLDSLHCAYILDRSNKQSILEKLKDINFPKGYPLQTTKINLARYIDGSLMSFRKVCPSTPSVQIKLGGKITGTIDLDESTTTRKTNGRSTSSEKAIKSSEGEITLDTSSGKPKDAVDKSTKTKVDNRKPIAEPFVSKQIVKLSSVDKNIGFNDFLLNEPIIHLTADRKNNLEFCEVPKGSFNLGITSDQYNETLILAGDKAFDLNIQDEVTKPDNQYVQISDRFFISKYELSRDQYNLIMKGQSVKDDLPFTEFTISELEALLKKLNSLYPNLHFDIPSEIEWEYAAKGSSEKYYLSSNDFYKIKDKVIVSDSTGMKSIYNKKCLLSHVNACNMIGNVKEICKSNNENYTQTFNQFDYVARGGSFMEDEFTARSTSRHLRKSIKSADVGIRLIVKKK